MKSLKNIIEMVVHVAPTIASAMNGTFAPVAVNFLAKNLLGTDGKLPDDIGNIVGELERALPDKLLELKQLEKSFQAEMAQLGVDVFALEVDDRKSARTLAEKDNRPQIYISIAFVVAYFLLLAGVFLAEVSPDYNPGMAFKNGEWVEQGESLVDLFKVLIGVLTAGIGQILSFWFGGTKSTSTNN